MEYCERCHKKLDPNEVVRLGMPFCSKCADYFKDFPRNPWPNNEVKWFFKSKQEIESLYTRLLDTIEKADDEKPIQEFLEKYPIALVQLFNYGHGRWVFNKPSLGGEYYPDFMVCGFDSVGPHWNLIELENPNYPVLTKKGIQSAKLTHAINQVRDWRTWLRNNISYAQKEYIGLDDEFTAYIIMSRRKLISEKNRQKYSELSSPKCQVMSYDRLISYVRRALDYLRI